MPLLSLRAFVAHKKCETYLIFVFKDKGCLSCHTGIAQTTLDPDT